MLDQDLYVREKLNELKSANDRTAQSRVAGQRTPVVAPLARPLGRMLHHIAHRLEAWAAVSPDVERELKLRSKVR